MTPTLVLASASAARARMLENAGVGFIVRPAGIDEDGATAALLAEGTPPRGIADALAELKALRASARDPDALVLGADQVLEFEGALISNANGIAEARDILLRLAGRTHKQHSAAVLARGGAVLWRHTATARLTMRPLTGAFVDDYLAREEGRILESVGCYRLEGLGIQLFAQIDGDYFTVLGLPLLPVLDALRNHGVLKP